jgi:hypothetical protein
MVVNEITETSLSRKKRRNLPVHKQNMGFSRFCIEKLWLYGFHRSLALIFFAAQ